MGHGDQKLAAPLRQHGRQRQLLLVIPQEGEVFRQAHQGSTLACSQVNLLFRRLQVGIGVRRTGELERCGKVTGQSEVNGQSQFTVRLSRLHLAGQRQSHGRAACRDRSVV
ncbi:MAG: hypothetical protein TE42_09030 [Candidatus Synechococcus spongiarum SP3]|uniref:Uncharacterized protein n=1 Tax=Candidatus Synechococcus spongiarum SP3 TaxID=1604020 RepID=A0A0G2HJG9_9SYNE|nr:MAG: hypothetical protein TE42_09030 [Candidatus Synechococcus spongiarum SP3]